MKVGSGTSLVIAVPYFANLPPLRDHLGKDVGRREARVKVAVSGCPDSPKALHPAGVQGSRRLCTRGCAGSGACHAGFRGSGSEVPLKDASKLAALSRSAAEQALAARARALAGGLPFPFPFVAWQSLAEALVEADEEATRARTAQVELSLAEDGDISVLGEAPKPSRPSTSLSRDPMRYAVRRPRRGPLSLCEVRSSTS